MQKLFVFFLVLIGACNSAPCDYHIDDFEAEVVGFRPYTKGGKNLFHVKLKFNVGKAAEGVLFLDELRGQEIDSAYLQNNYVYIGRIYTGVLSEAKNTSCATQRLVSFNNAFIE